MGAKKRADGGKQVTDDSTEQLYRAYRRNLNEMSIQMLKILEDKFLEIRDEKNPGFLTELKVWELWDPEGLRAFADALRDTTYVHLKSIRLWGANTGDEGTRSLCQFMRVTNCVTVLEMIRCELTFMSCRFLSRLLEPVNQNQLSVLRLDHNTLGNQGVIDLAEGLSMNSFLKKLTLSYCEFNQEACRALMQILIFQESALQELDIQGNAIGFEGLSKVLHGLKINQVLFKLVAADISLEADDSFLEKMIEMLLVNTSLCAIDLHRNSISDETAKDWLDRMRHSPTGRINSVLNEIELPEEIPEETKEEFKKFLLPNKKGKKGKKGKKKAKK